MVAIPVSTPESLLDANALHRLYAALRDIPLVQRIGYSLSPGLVHLWVLLTHDDDDSFRQAIAAEMAFRRELGTAPVDMHFFALDEIDPHLLPPTTVVFDR